MFNHTAIINITKKNWLSKCLKAERWHLNLRIYICDPSSSCYILLVTVCPCVCSRECMCVKVTSRGANGRSTVIVSHLRDLPSDILAVSHFSHAHSGWTTASFIVYELVSFSFLLHFCLFCVRFRIDPQILWITRLASSPHQLPFYSRDRTP